MPWQTQVDPPPPVDAGTDAKPAADGGPMQPPIRDGGPLLVNPGLDPDADFIWVQTQPGAPGACEPGTYAGSFSCTFDTAGGFSRMIGSIELTLAPGNEAGRLDVSKGRMLGFSGEQTASFSATMQGELDCNGAEFTASTKNSISFTLPSDWDGPTAPMSIDGTLDGNFDAEALTLEGDVLLTTSGGWKCTGKFRAQLSR